VQSRGTLNSEHDRHDRVLVARYAANDAYRSEIDRAKRLVDDCDECASLAADIRVISARTNELPTLKRPRDFRISHEQADQLRGSWFERVMRNFQAPGWAVVRPLAGAAIAIGIVLVVVGALPLDNFTSHTASDALPAAAPITTQTDLRAVTPSTAHVLATAAASQSGAVPEAAATSVAASAPADELPTYASASATSADSNASVVPQPGYGVGGQPAASAAASMGGALTSEPPRKGVSTGAPQASTPAQQASTPAPQPVAEATEVPEVAALSTPAPAPSAAPVANGGAQFSDATGAVNSNSSPNQPLLVVGGAFLILLALITLALVWIARRRYSDPLAR
jgi:hypothetical protein